MANVVEVIYLQQGKKNKYDAQVKKETYNKRGIITKIKKSRYCNIDKAERMLATF